MPAVGPGVCEVRIHADGERRVTYVAKFRHGIYVPLAFHKETQKTAKGDLEKAKARLKAALQMEVNAS